MRRPDRAPRHHVPLDRDGTDRPVEALEPSQRPVPSDPLIERAASGGEVVRTQAIACRPPRGGPCRLVARLGPHCGDGEPDATSITCADVTEHADPAAQQYERACRRLRSIVAELAAVNADLHSVRAELRSTQRELRETNNELSFVYVELLTAHARLLSANEQLRIRADKQAHKRALIEAALDSLGTREGRDSHRPPDRCLAGEVVAVHLGPMHALPAWGPPDPLSGSRRLVGRRTACFHSARIARIWKRWRNGV